MDAGVPGSFLALQPGVAVDPWSGVFPTSVPTGGFASGVADTAFSEVEIEGTEAGLCWPGFIRTLVNPPKTGEDDTSGATD